MNKLDKKMESKTSTPRTLKKAVEKQVNQIYILNLYICGLSQRSTSAIENIRKISEKNLKGRYKLEVIDIFQQPEEARKEQIIAAPTLIKKLPLPLRKFIGDLSNTKRILAGLEINE